MVVALLASIPGTVITVDRNFRFADRWRWHQAVATRYLALEHKLAFEGAAVEDVSREMGEFLEEMEKKYPSGVSQSMSKRELK